MANLPISQLPATTAINDNDLFAIEQNGVTKRVDYATIKPAATGDLPAVNAVSSGDLLEITQGGVAKKVTVQQLLASVSGGGINFGSLPQATSIGDTDEFLINQGGTQKKVSGLDLKRLIAGNAIYPVGSIYMSTSPTNPATYFGGTWVAYATGRTIVGIDSSDTDFATVGKTGGKKSHFLRAAIGASNNDTRTLSYKSAPAIPNQTTVTSYTVFGESQTNASRTFNHATPVYDSNGKDPSTLQPYITTYIWQRTA